MTLLEIVTLGVVQGITEFLPVSSSAHLVLVPLLTGWPDQGIVFDIAVHLGTLGAVMWYFRADTWRMILGALDHVRGRFKTEDARLLQLLAVATIPVGIAGLLLKDFVETQGRSFVVLGLTSLIFGLLLGLADRRTEGADVPVAKFGLKHVLMFGVLQALAVIPGTSRSGITMTAGRLLGLSRDTSAYFSMLMAIPVIVLVGGASAGDMFHAEINWHTALWDLLSGAAISFLAAMLAIHGLMKLIGKTGFWPFVLYRVVLGVILLYLAPDIQIGG
ncbi:MAG: undecaprenyl-diphosphate phosphatase [Proteobacteria bacterium]|nr:undecaprenyl-diphosphate phosphatase [Pseudomonadota bacterium]